MNQRTTNFEAICRQALELPDEKLVEVVEMLKQMEPQEPVVLTPHMKKEEELPTNFHRLMNLALNFSDEELKPVTDSIHVIGMYHRSEVARAWAIEELKKRGLG